MTVYSVRHAFPEGVGFEIKRKAGYPAYTFLHFFTPIEISTKEGTVKSGAHAFIIYEPVFPQWFKSEREILHDWMHFDVEAPSFFQEYGIPLNTVFYPKNPEILSEIIRELEVEFYSERNMREALIRLKLEELFIKLGRLLNEDRIPPVSKEILARFKALREDNFLNLSKNRNAAEMASAVGLSPSRFFTLYKRIFGVSPIDDLINAKISAAQITLFSSDAKMENIAAELGYENITHFIRQFKSRTGKTPSEYRLMSRLK